MPKEERLLTAYDTAQLNKISSYLCQAIIDIQEDHPELLLEKYRNVEWLSSANKSALTAKFTEILSQAQDWDALPHKLQGYLKALLIPESINSPILKELIEKIHQLNYIKTDLNGCANLTKIKSPETVELTTNSLAIENKGIAVLLLDAENLQINSDTEKFLTRVCNFPIQVKIAFANWCSMGRLDVELHGRGYDLIHVPVGRDNADGKMIVFGSSIHDRYPNAQEVLVCSSDKVMTNLCNHLQQNGLVVYRVSKQEQGITIFNSYTGNITHFPAPAPEIPTIEQFIQQIKELIKAEQKQNKSCWIKLATISEAFKNKYNLTITKVVAKHLPGKKARDILMNFPGDLVVHQVDADSELYVTIFEINQSQPAASKGDALPSNPTSPLLYSINSKADLEQVLNNILNQLTQQSPGSYINISNLGSIFNKQYGKPITEQMKSLQINGTFLKFLQSCSSLKLKEVAKGWEVATT